MAKYRDFDDDYRYDDEDDYEYIERKRSRSDKNRNVVLERRAEREYDNRVKPKKPRKKMKRWVKVLICILEVIVLIGLLGTYYIVDKLGKINIEIIDEEFIMDNKDEMDEDTVKTLQGYTNILLLGSDNRDNSVEALDKKLTNHTDAIIICSINNDTKEIKLVSVYRDTVLKVTDPENTSTSELRKITEANFFYGTQASLNAINVNLDLNITDYVMVNWSALIDIIDAVGGIDIEITEEEREWLNAYLVDTSVNTGKKYEEVENSGYVHLDGIQATAYCRIRYTAGSDYKRTERQRTVLSKIFEKAKGMNLAQLNSAIDSVVGNISTSLSVGEIIEMASHLTKYSLAGTVGFPFEVDDTGVVMVNGKESDVVAPVDLKSNVSQLHQFLFGTENYTPTATVQDISKQISTAVIYPDQVTATEKSTEKATEQTTQKQTEKQTE